MSRQIGFLIAILCGSVLSVGQRNSVSFFHEHRESASDLEISGKLPGLPPGKSKFVSREQLLALSQASLSLKSNQDIPGISKSGLMVSGVFLDTLAQSLGAAPDASAVEARCADGYAATFSNEYLRLHRPFFVLRIDGMDLHEWAVRNRQYDSSPYMIGYDDFAPAFHVLSHKDERFEPTGILRLRFDTEEAVYAGIRPESAKNRESTPIMQGYLIARQNCFRCHNVGDRGGTKAGRDWHTLGVIARTRPIYFAAWVHNPKTIKPKSMMPPNPTYSKATLQALTRYFQTFAVEER